MAIIKKITQPGNNIVATLNGQISIDEGRGRFVIYDPVLGQEVTIMDRTGFLTTNGDVTTEVNPEGITQSDSTGPHIFLGDEDA